MQKTQWPWSIYDQPQDVAIGGETQDDGDDISIDQYKVWRKDLVKSQGLSIIDSRYVHASYSIEWCCWDGLSESGEREAKLNKYVAAGQCFLH